MELKRLTFFTFSLIIIAIISIAMFTGWTFREILMLSDTSKAGLSLMTSLRKIQGQTNELLVTDNLPLSYLHWLDVASDFRENLHKFQDSPRLHTLLRNESIKSRYSAFLILSERALYSIDSISEEYMQLNGTTNTGSLGLFINPLYGKNQKFTRIADEFRKTSNYFSSTYENTIIPLVMSLEKISSASQKKILAIAVTVSALIIMLTVFLLIFIRREENRVKEERLNIEMRMNKFELLKYFASGIAHDFNNYLGAIFGNISIAKTYVDPGTELSDILNDIENASEQAIGLTKQFMTFSKGDASNRKVINVEETIRNTASFILRGSSIKCEFDFKDDLFNIEIDESRFCEVINNILINSMQALPQEGIITISATNTYLKKANSKHFSAGDYVNITISDNGPGIPLDIQDKIFNPFFSTKNKGSGLGLAICYSIIHENGGFLSFESDERRGTAFHIYLKATLDLADERPRENHTFKRGSGKILLMDDDEKIRITVSRMLKQLGYEPETVSEGVAAVKTYRQALRSNTPFKAVILDFTIPGGMGAKETIAELLKTDKSVKAVISSGYSIASILPEYKKYGFAAYLKKGYSIQELGTVMSELTSDG